jgi:predicted negative regulator of RcsB-dependent stress response
MDTEEEQLEELKRWWREHGRTVVAGVVLGLGTVGGWTWWQGHVTAQAEAVSVLYDRLVSTAAGVDHTTTVEQADAIIAQHPDSGYAALSALVGAHAAWRQQDATTARRLLEWAVEHGQEFQVADVARLRLARVLSQAGEHESALATLGQVSGEPFAALVAEARGDVLAARDDSAGAEQAYEAALAEDALPASARGRIELKRDALALRGG